MFIMANVLSEAKRVQVVAALVEGNSLRATARMAGVSRNTVAKLLNDLGTACAAYQDEHLRDLSCKRIQADEIWSFVYAKAKNVPDDKKGEFGVGDVWTFTAIDADSKLCVSYRVGPRDGATATEFMHDIASRLANRVQLTTDGHVMYLEAVESAFGADIDYAMLQKIYGMPPAAKAEHRYSPAECIGTKRAAIQGRPNIKHVSTSYVERANLTMRMSMRRFTRLTNAFSKKLEAHVAAISLHFMYYNFCRVNGSLNGKTPAMAAGIADRPWKIEQLVGLLNSDS